MVTDDERAERERILAELDAAMEQKRRWREAGVSDYDVFHGRVPPGLPDHPNPESTAVLEDSWAEMWTKRPALPGYAWYYVEVVRRAEVIEGWVQARDENAARRWAGSADAGWEWGSYPHLDVAVYEESGTRTVDSGGPPSPVPGQEELPL